MPILDDIMDSEVLGRERKRGIALGLEKGREEGERKLVLRQIEARFGSISPTTRQKIDNMSASELESFGLRLLDVRTLEEVFT
jgi:hypothetical protein